MSKTRLFFWELSWLVSVIQRKLLFAASQSPIDVTPTTPCVKQRCTILIFSLHNLAFLTIHHLKRTFFYPVYFLSGKILYALLLQLYRGGIQIHHYYIRNVCSSTPFLFLIYYNIFPTSNFP